MLHDRDGVRCVMSCARFLPDLVLYVQAKEFTFHLIRPNNILHHALKSLSCAPLQTPGMLWYAFCLRSGFCLATLSKSLDLWRAAETVVLLAGSPILAWELWVIGHLPDQGPSCPVAQFGWTNSRKNLGSYICFPFPNDGAHCALGNFQHTRNGFIPFPGSMPPRNSISEFYGQFLGLHGRIFALACTVICGVTF